MILPPLVFPGWCHLVTKLGGHFHFCPTGEIRSSPEKTFEVGRRPELPRQNRIDNTRIAPKTAGYWRSGFRETVPRLLVENHFADGHFVDTDKWLLTKWCDHGCVSHICWSNARWSNVSWPNAIWYNLSQINAHWPYVMEPCILGKEHCAIYLLVWRYDT